MAKTERAKYQLALGAWELPQRIQQLRDRWPNAFPAQDDDIRPLAKQGPTPAIMAAMGWTNSYTTGLLKQWKSRHAYANAVLRHGDCINLDGSLSGETVTDTHREQAKRKLTGPEPAPAEPVAPPKLPHACSADGTAGGGNGAFKRAEHLRGMKASSEHIAILREKWPTAFPVDNKKVRPLAAVTTVIAEATGWTPSFTHGVLAAWKSRLAYCYAVLNHNERINLDGSPSGAMVDDAARAMAKHRLGVIAARKAEKQARLANEAKTTNEAAAIAPPPEPTPVPVAASVPVAPPVAAVPEPTPQVEVIETPEQLRAHLRASLLKRRAPTPSSAAAP